MPSYAPSQDGQGRLGPANWNDTLDYLTVSNSAFEIYTGLRYQLHTSFDSESRPIEPALIWPSFDLAFYLQTQQVGSADLTLSFVPESAPAAYSATVQPSLRSEVALSYVDETAATVTVANGTAVGTIVSFPSVSSTLLVPYLRSSSYNGYLCFTVTCESGDRVVFHSSRATTAAFHPTFSTTEVAFHTGVLDGPAMGHRARSRLCPRTGIPVSSDEMVRDGYSEGLMVSPDAWDPEAPDDRYAPSPHEGVVDDEV